MIDLSNLPLDCYLIGFFLSDAVIPKAALAGWYSAIATYNPVTYLVDALRSLIMTGWETTVLAKGDGALGGMGLVTFTVALLALRGRVRQTA
jgi:ABC-2 type transport system permease protein